MSMRRQFRVDASKKIQAAPVDFGVLDSMQPLMHDAALDMFEQHREELIAYADAKFEEVANQINSDIREIFSRYLHDNVTDIDTFLDIFYGFGYDVSIHSTILNRLNYNAYNDDGDIITEIFPLVDDIEIETPDVGFVLWIDSYEGDGPLEIRHCGGSRFVEAGLEIIFCSAANDFYRKQVTADTLISTCQQIIYEYAEFVDTQLSKILEEAIMKYFEQLED